MDSSEEDSANDPRQSARSVSGILWMLGSKTATSVIWVREQNIVSCVTSMAN